SVAAGARKRGRAARGDAGARRASRRARQSDGNHRRLLGPRPARVDGDERCDRDERAPRGGGAGGESAVAGRGAATTGGTGDRPHDGADRTGSDVRVTPDAKRRAPVTKGGGRR